MQRFGYSQRNVLHIVAMSLSTDGYKACSRNETALKMRIKEITDTRVHYGYRKVCHALSRRPSGQRQASVSVVSARRLVAAAKAPTA